MTLRGLSEIEEVEKIEEILKYLHKTFEGETTNLRTASSEVKQNTNNEDFFAIGGLVVKSYQIGRDGLSIGRQIMATSEVEDKE